MHTEKAFEKGTSLLEYLVPLARTENMQGKLKHLLADYKRTGVQVRTQVKTIVFS